MRSIPSVDQSEAPQPGGHKVHELQARHASAQRFEVQRPGSGRGGCEGGDLAYTREAQPIRNGQFARRARSRAA
ncbi:MAG: hypothetical protein ACT6RP_02590 [Roseateles sp.]